MGDVQCGAGAGLERYERPRRSGEARVGAGAASAGGRPSGPVLLWIDDAHVLHGQTLRGLKRLRELAGRGGSAPAVVLTGQSDGTERVAEVGLRTDVLRLAGLSRAEAAEALGRALNRERVLVGPEAAAALAASERARCWLDLQRLADDCLLEAAACGADAVDASCVVAVLRPGARRGAAKPKPKRVDDAAVSALLERRGAA